MSKSLRRDDKNSTSKAPSPSVSSSTHLSHQQETHITRSNMAPSTSTLTFPHPKLTPIVGTPTNSGIKQLTKEIYANARAIPSTRGGGGHGHLGLVMPVGEYMVITGVAFQLPAHPGQAPIHAPNATQFQIAETVRLFDATLAELTTATTAREEMKKQLLEAVSASSSQRWMTTRSVSQTYPSPP